MSFTKKKIMIILIVVICFLVITLVFKPFGKNSKFITSKIERRDIIQKVEASGTVNPVQTVSIGSQVSGMIKEIYVDFNSTVKKGQQLAQIDPALFQAQVDQARATLESRKADYQQIKSVLAYDKVNYERYKILYKKKYVSKNELDLAQATYLAKQAELEATKASISQANATLQNNLTNLRYTKIISPVEGVVVSREVDVGQTVAASFQTPTLFLVAQDLTKMQIEVSVSEADIGKVKTGQVVEYTLDGYPNEIFKGKVTQVRISPTTVSNVVTYTVVVGVDNDNRVLKPGMSANVEIITNERKNILCVENAAMRYSPKDLTGGKKFKEQGIWVLKKSNPKRTVIKQGITDSDYTEVISNELNEGDEVIVGNSNPKEKKQNNMPKGPRMF